jgi:hypothetical protein
MPWQCNPIHQQAFDNFKATVTKEVVLVYPDFLKPFKIYTDAPTMQLGAMTTQDYRPISFLSQKCNINTV